MFYIVFSVDINDHFPKSYAQLGPYAPLYAGHFSF